MRSEEEVLGFWAQKKIFERSVKQRKGARRFVFFEGPPYANGAPGIHHVEARSFKDVVARYQTMRGFLVERRAGWDTHGLPTEMAAEKKLGITRKRDIEEKIGIKKFIETAREDVFYYKAEWERLTERMGYWLDFKNAYVTLKNDYIESLWWVVREFWKKKLLYEDDKILPWCTRCGTALSSHELAQGYKKITEDSVFVRFRLKTRRASLLVWTTTPWTLPANVAVAVHPDKKYVTVEDQGEKYIVLDALAKKLFPDVKRPLWEEKGKDLNGLEYEAPYPAPGNPYKVILADFVSAEEGSGGVHIAPAFGEDDMALGRREKLPVYNTVDDEGRFTDAVPQWKGVFVKDADSLIIKDLEHRGLLWKKIAYTHEYPFCWRCDSPLLYFARRSWWVRVSSMRSQLVDANKKINWYPGHLKDGRFGQWIAEAKDWAFSRERYWGTPLPVWQCATCKTNAVFSSVDDISERARTSKNTYYLMRHGFAKTNLMEVIWSNPKGDIYGLTPRGVREARAALKKLAREKIDLIISSDLLRSKETTHILAKVLKTPVLYDTDLRELHFGEFEGKSEDTILAWRKNIDPERDAPPGGGESWNDLKRRMYHMYRNLETLHQGKRILLVSHGDPLWFLEAMMKGDLESDTKPHAKYLRQGEYHKIKSVSVPRNDFGELDLHRPYIDEVVVDCTSCGGPMTRVRDVIDVWFDSGAMPYAQWHYPFENKERIDKKLSYPADYIAEAIDQTRGWFYTLLVVSVLLGKGAPYKNVLSLGHVLDKTGKKMSKSKGNVVDPKEMIQKYGADAVRWYFFTINQPDDTKLFDEKDIEQAKRNYIDLFTNTLRFYELYKDIRQDVKESHVLDIWIYAKLALVRDEVTKRMDTYDIVGAARILEDFVANDISRWYVRRSRERMKEGSGISILREVLLEVARLAAPFIPFTAEIVYSTLGGARESVHLELWPEKRTYAKKVLVDMEEVRRVASIGLELRAASGIKVRQPLAKLIMKKTRLGQDAYFGLLREELNVKEIVVDPKIQGDIMLDTVITSELKKEGVAREVVRSIQEMRKRAGLHPRDFINVTVEGESFGEFEDRVKDGARIKHLIMGGMPGTALLSESFDINGASYTITIERNT